MPSSPQSNSASRAAPTGKLSPMLAQYQRIKAEHPDVLLMFRMGDFYEMFGEDAKVASELLEITLTSRPAGGAERTPLCGVPYHALDRYLAKLIALGLRVAVCEQIEDPKLAKGIVKRAVTRVVTPGTLLEDGMLEARVNNYLAVAHCAVPHAKEGAAATATEGGEPRFGLAVADISTGEFGVTQLTGLSCLAEEVGRLTPAELLLSGDAFDTEAVKPHVRGRVDRLEEDPFPARDSAAQLCDHFGTTSLRGFGCEGLPLAIEAAAGLLRYLRAHQEAAARHLRTLSTWSTEDHMALDANTRRHLELVQATGAGPTARSLLQVLDRSVTAMGGRALRRWVLLPLLNLEEIHRRQEAVEEFVSGALLRGDVRDGLRRVSDVERLTTRASTGVCSPRDLGQLRASLRVVPDVVETLAEARSAPLVWLREGLDPLPELAETLERALVDEPPLNLRDGGVIREGFSAELDELRDAAAGGKAGIARLEAEERERTGIPNLKVGFNSVFGYYIEVSKSNVSRVPADYHRKQTTANGERYLTPKLKEFEAAVLGAEERAGQLEATLFEALRSEVAGYSPRLLALAGGLANLDALAALAEAASANGYTRPLVDEGGVMEITGGRHPVVEQAALEPFVPNDLLLGPDDQRLLVITGPNMAGKSTFLRQTALITLMAQIGSFVPATSARIGRVDRIFTRVGAHDDLAGGQSTFMVEMNEAANILNNATDQSLVILDEIGRGTSTFDGLSIAWAIVEFLAQLGAKTLFATHYHQLNDLERQLPGVKNFRVLVKEQGHRIVWLRKIAPGGTDKSYGIQVARLAGLPESVVDRAREVLADLEATGRARRPGKVSERTEQVQLTFFEAETHPVVDALKALDVETLTPLEALTTLAALQRLVKG